MFRLTALLIASFALGAAACSAADRDADDGVEIVDSSPLSLDASPLVGHWRSRRDVYATTLALADDGTFTGDLRRSLVDGKSCDETETASAAPCLIAVHGRWRLQGENLQLRVLPSTYVQAGKTVTLPMGFSRQPRVLTLRGDDGEQALAEHYGCDGVTCATGSRCEESDDGAARCVAKARN